jgi:hypothetical protein
MPGFWQKDSMLKVQALFQDGAIALEFMTGDASEAEEMRQQWLAFDCVAQVMVLDEPGWVAL